MLLAGWLIQYIRSSYPAHGKAISNRDLRSPDVLVTQQLPVMPRLNGGQLNTGLPSGRSRNSVLTRQTMATSTTAGCRYKVKIKLSLYLIKHYAMTTYGGVEV
jgi:hypothetical protein